ncbi:nuclear transport factor 2 family protein [Leptolyngbya sp. NIES-2104]|uniref:nuclear transport factor 2 family protein n=1 Tax=Leptolyngbya sp. NIES-2104 TaxID=1552121 RepID=UPI0006EC7E1D|nr:nuclear transport factor 2 family protein [Leptolyngbya sp. NIES-2104]GAQ00120.1 hypothetical protein NIES2104_66850 [Leptolyngbya sp. NIES-2104]
MRSSHLILVTAGLCATLIGVSTALIHFNQESARDQTSELSPSPAPLPSIASTARPSIEDFVSRYFEALDEHDFDTAYAFLSPAWGIERGKFQRYWEQFKAGSIQAEILNISQSSAQSVIVVLRWSGNNAGKTVKVRLRCSLRTTPTSYRIDRCK